MIVVAQRPIGDFWTTAGRVPELWYEPHTPEFYARTPRNRFNLVAYSLQWNLKMVE